MAGLSACSKSDTEEATAVRHPAQQYRSRILANHRWTGVERDYVSGVHDIRTQLPDTSFSVSYSNDTTVRVSAIDMPYNGLKSTQSGDPALWFYGYDKSSNRNYFLIYYPNGDSLQYEERILTMFSVYNRLYSSN